MVYRLIHFLDISISQLFTISDIPLYEQTFSSPNEWYDLLSSKCYVTHTFPSFTEKKNKKNITEQI